MRRPNIRLLEGAPDNINQKLYLEDYIKDHEAQNGSEIATDKQHRQYHCYRFWGAFRRDDARTFYDRDHLSIGIWQCTYLVLLAYTSIFALACHAERDGGFQVRRACGNIHGS